MTSQRRQYPYFKVQSYDTISMTWKERKQGFDSLDEAKEYVQKSLIGKRTRIVRVDESGYQEVEND